MRLRIAHERLDLAQDPLADAGCVEVTAALDDPGQGRIAEELAVGVHRLGDAVCIHHDDVSRVDRPRVLFEKLLDLRNDLGLLAEELDPRLKRQVGNFPQAFSHVPLIDTALRLTASGAYGG